MENADPSNKKLTGAGCATVLLSVLVIFAVALPIAHWRDPNTGRPFPRMVAIFGPIIIGACFNAAVGFLLHLIGIECWKPTAADDSTPRDDIRSPGAGTRDSRNGVGD